MASTEVARDVFSGIAASCRATGYKLTEEDREAVQASSGELGRGLRVGCLGGLGMSFAVSVLHLRGRRPTAAHYTAGLVLTLATGDYFRDAAMPKALDILLARDTPVSSEAAHLLHERFPEDPFTRTIALEQRTAPRILTAPAPSFAASGVARDPRHAVEARRPRGADDGGGPTGDATPGLGAFRQQVGAARDQAQVQEQAMANAEHVWRDDFPAEIPMIADEWQPHDDDLSAGMGDEGLKSSSGRRHSRYASQDGQQGAPGGRRRGGTNNTHSSEVQPYKPDQGQKASELADDGWGGASDGGHSARTWSPEPSQRPRARWAAAEPRNVTVARPRGASDSSTMDTAEGVVAGDEPNSRSQQRHFKVATAQGQSEHVWDDYS